MNYVSREKFLANQLALNQNELKYLDHQYEGMDTGDEFTNLDPHLSADFDLFGKGSLFQYLNRTSTLNGKKRLAKEVCIWDSEQDSILERQKAIQELSEKIDFNLKFRTYGMLLEEKGEELMNLNHWLDQITGENKRLRILTILIPLLNLIWITLMITGIFTIVSFLIPLFTSYFILYLHSKKINEAHSRLGNTAQTFKKYATLIRLIEDEKFQSGYLMGLKNKFYSGNGKASDSLRSLFKLLNRFDLRLNMLVSFVLNSLFLFDLQIYLQLEKWKAVHRNLISPWFDSLSEIDALLSYATFSFSNKDFICWPTIMEGYNYIEATELGHPLLHPSTRVCNDLKVKGNPSVLIITGANMAGKSTFLRTIAVNLILAMNGAPVCARNFHFTPCDILSSIKIQDSLMNKESYFYAELVRLKEIIDHVRITPKTLVILDEILRGTNSKDKHEGSLGLLEKLISLNATVIIATHDLGIGELERKYPNVVSNNCFEVELENDQLVFDYKLKKGLSQKLNASFLMKKMEIIN
jgi:DNA mismatch repair ATPase MutS